MTVAHPLHGCRQPFPAGYEVVPHPPPGAVIGQVDRHVIGGHPRVDHDPGAFRPEPVVLTPWAAAEFRSPRSSQRPRPLPPRCSTCARSTTAAPVARPVGDGDGSYVLYSSGSREDWVRGHYERLRPCCTALPRGPCTRRPADPAAACPETPTPAQSPRPRPVRPLGSRAVLHDPHPPRIRGLRWWMRLLPANPTHRRARHDRGTACTVATDAVTGTVAAQQRAGGDTVQNRRNYRQGVVVW